MSILLFSGEKKRMATRTFSIRLVAIFFVVVAYTITGCPQSNAADVAKILNSFDGDQGTPLSECHPETMRCRRQPEMDVAVNGKEVVQITRQNVLVFDYSGKRLRSTSTIEFIRRAGLDPMPPAPEHPNPEGGNGPYEPHVIFDEFIGRWIITITCHSDCLLVSASADPLGPWGGVYLSCAQGGPCLNHDPALHVGFDRNGLYYCGGHIGDHNPNGVPGVAYDCFAIPAAEVHAVAQGELPEHIARQHNMPLNIQPAIDHDSHKSPGSPALFMAKTCGHEKPNSCLIDSNYSFEWLVSAFTWQGTSGNFTAIGDEQKVKTDIGSKANKWLYNFPCCGPRSAIPQAATGLPLRSGASSRLMDVVQQGSDLYGVISSGPCTQDCGAQGIDKNNLLFWTDIDCSNHGACVVRQTGKISGDDILPLVPTIGVDKDGNIGIVAASATVKTYLSVLLWTHHRTDAPDVLRGPLTVVAGTQPYTCPPKDGVTLTGNAAGLFSARDPSDGTKLWVTEQWGNHAEQCVWDTRIVEYQIPATKAK